MPDLNLYLVKHSGRSVLIRAADRNAVKAFVLEEVKYSATRPSGTDVADIMANGGKVITVDADGKVQA